MNESLPPHVLPGPFDNFALRLFFVCWGVILVGTVLVFLASC